MVPENGTNDIVTCHGTEQKDEGESGDLRQEEVLSHQKNFTNQSSTSFSRLLQGMLRFILTLKGSTGYVTVPQSQDGGGPEKGRTSDVCVPGGMTRRTARMGTEPRMDGNVNEQRPDP